jgi:hypothetical protein
VISQERPGRMPKKNRAKIREIWRVSRFRSPCRPYPSASRTASSPTYRQSSAPWSPASPQGLSPVVFASQPRGACLSPHRLC